MSSFRIFSKLIVALALMFVSQSLAADDETGDYIHYRLGIKYKNEKKYDQAVDEFRRVLAAYPDNYNAYMHMSEVQVEQKNYRFAIYNLKKALTYNPGWGKAHKLLASSYESDGQLQKAIIELQAYQQSCDPAEHDSLQNVMNRLVARVNGEPPPPSDDEKAVQNLKKNVEQKTPLSKQTKPSTAVESTPASKINVKPAQETSPKNSQVEAAFKQAVEFYNQHQFDSALDKLKEVLSAQPEYTGAFYYAGLIRRRNGQNKLAKINFLKSVNYPDMGFNSYYYLGRIYGEEKDYPEAIKHLELYLPKTKSEQGKKDALELLDQYRKLAGITAPVIKDSAAAKTTAEPFDAIVVEANYKPLEIRIDSLLSMITMDTLTDVGQKMLNGINDFKNGDFDKAIKDFRTVMTTNPNNETSVHCLYNTGVCYFKLHLYKQAENQFQIILDRFPRHSLSAQCAFLKAVSFHERGETASAEKLYRQYLQTYRGHDWNGKAFEKLGDCYLELEDPKKAIDAYTQATTQSSSPVDKVCAFFKLGTTYSQIGNTQRAITSFFSAIEQGEKNNVYIRVPDSYYKIADIKYQLKEYKNALEIYKKVTRKYPAYQETPWGFFQIGSIYKNLEQYQDAIEVFKDLMKRYPDDYWSRQAQWKMDDAVWEHEYRGVLK